MKKIFLISLTLLSLASSSLLAEDKKTSLKVAQKSYVGAGFGFTDVTAYDTGYSLILHAGKSLPKVDKEFGVEGAFSHTLVDPAYKSIDLTITTIAGYATYNFNFSPEIKLKAKGGILYERLSANTTTDEFEVSYGFKVLYALKSKKSLYLDYTIVEKDIAIFSLGLEF